MLMTDRDVARPLLGEKVHSAAPSDALSDPNTRNGQAHPTVNGKREGRILVVEDSPTQALRLRCVLEGAGYEVEVALDGEKGFDLFGASEFDLVISDIQMPGISGYELCRKKIGRG